MSDLLHRKDSSLGGPWPHAISHCIAFVKTANQCAPSSNTEYSVRRLLAARLWVGVIVPRAVCPVVFSMRVIESVIWVI